MASERRALPASPVLIGILRTDINPHGEAPRIAAVHDLDRSFVDVPNAWLRKRD